MNNDLYKDPADRFKIEPLAKQKEFILDTTKYSCYNGGYGSGKTYAGCLRALMLSTMYPNNFGLIGRLTYPELRNTTRRTFFEVCPPEYYDSKRGGFWKTSENHLRLINGSEIMFTHLDTVSEAELRSLNIGWFYIDQAEEIGERVWDVLISRLRLNTVPRRFGFITCNPDPGSWIYYKFKKPYEEGKPDKDFFLIESTSYENPHNPEGYAAGLEKQYNKAAADRFVYGKWDAFEGKIYPDFAEKIHVIRPFNVPKEWETLVGIDHGMVNPTAAIWAAIDYDGNVFIFDCYYNPGIVSQHAKEILGRHSDRSITYYIDPSTVAKTREKDGMPWSIMEEYEDNGIYAIPANNEKLAGINRVSEFLKVQEHRINPITGEKRSPKMFIFSTCQDLVWEMKQYQWKKLRSLQARNEPEAPRDFQDHACFAGSTLITTKRGDIPIKEVTTEDFVWTPFGWSAVEESGRVGRKKVYDWGVFTATGDHPVFTTDGFLRLDILGDKNIIMKWKCLNALSGKKEYIDDIRSQDIGLIVATLSVLHQRSLEAKQDIYIERFGNFIMEKYPKVVRLIILMEILLIILLTTWSFLRTRSTPVGIVGAFIQVTRNIWKKLDLLPRSGTGAEKEGKNIQRLQKNHGRIERKKSKPANLVEHSMGHFFLVEAGTVIKTAKHGKEEDVYNLKTSNGMYVANGVLTSNCDALRYIIMTRFPTPSRRPDGHAMVTPSSPRNDIGQPFTQDQKGDPVLGQFYG